MKRLLSFLSFMALGAILASESNEMQYRSFKQPVVEDGETKPNLQIEPKPVYPPTKKKPYTRTTRIA